MVLYNTETKMQRIIAIYGQENKSTTITALAVNVQKKVLAVAEKSVGLCPSIHIYDLATCRKRKSYVLNYDEKEMGQVRIVLCCNRFVIASVFQEMASYS